MSETKNCCCCRQRITRGATLYIFGNTIGRHPHVAGKTVRLWICEACITGEGKPLLVNFAQELVTAALAMLDGIFVAVRPRTPAGDSRGAKKAKGAAV